MKASDFVTVWSAADNSRLTANQISLRLPVHVAAKLPYFDTFRTQVIDSY